MTPDNTGSDTAGGKRRLNRRSMLMALGAGSSVALASPYGAARFQEGDGGGEEGDGNGGGRGGANGRQCPPCIDAYSGYLQAGETRDGQQQPGRIDPVTTVELRVEDVDVVFPDEEAAGGTGTEAPDNETVGTTTPTPSTETPNVTMETEAGNETIVGENETGNETIVGGNETGTETVADENETGTETVADRNETGTETEMAGGEPQGIPDFYFNPVGIRLRPGDSVEFLVREQLHTVTAFHPRFGFQQRVPDGVPGFTSPPFLERDSWYYRFDETGVYDMLCLPHLGLGMVMRAVVVEEGAEEIPKAYPEPDQEAGIPPVALKVLNAPELAPQNVVNAGSVQWTDLSNVASEPPVGFE